VDTGHVVAIRTQHQARPGRRAIVVTDLASLKGPAHGIVELPWRLYWSSPDRTFDLDKPFMRRWMYQIVLREAALPDELTTYLNADLLVAMWADLVLPRGVRRAWEEHHPALQVAAAATG
jgi:hypothetical protein